MPLVLVVRRRDAQLLHAGCPNQALRAREMRHGRVDLEIEALDHTSLRRDHVDQVGAGGVHAIRDALERSEGHLLRVVVHRIALLRVVPTRAVLGGLRVGEVAEQRLHVQQVAQALDQVVRVPIAVLLAALDEANQAAVPLHRLELLAPRLRLVARLPHRLDHSHRMVPLADRAEQLSHFLHVAVRRHRARPQRHSTRASVPSLAF